MKLDLKNTKICCPQDNKQQKLSGQEKPSHNVTVRIFSNDAAITKKQRQLGKFHRLNKTYFYKERILLFYMLHFFIQNRRTKSQKIKYQCERILNLFQECIRRVGNSIQNEQQKSRSVCNNLFPNQGQNFCVSKLQGFIQKLKHIKNIQNDQILNCNGQVYSLLDVLLGKWVKMQIVSASFFADLEDIMQQTIKVENVNIRQKIIPLTVFIQEKNHINNQTNGVTSQANRKQKHLLYKNLTIMIGGQKVAQIIETNQQKYVFFRLEQTLKNNFNQMSRLFGVNDRLQLLQSQGQKSQSDKNSEIVLDEEFYRISSKISISCRKNSFNSGEKHDTGFEQKDLFSQNSQFDQHVRQKSQNRNKKLVSEIYTRSSSFQKGNLLTQDNLYTSIDLFKKIQTGGDILNDKRKRSCQNTRSYHKSVQKSQQIKMLTKIASNMKINLIDEAKTNIYSEDFKSAFTKKLQTPSSFQQLGKRQGQNRKNVIRSFFKQNILQDRQ